MLLRTVTPEVRIDMTTIRQCTRGPKRVRKTWRKVLAPGAFVRSSRINTAMRAVEVELYAA